MVTRIALLLGVVTLFLVACGGGDSDLPASTATRAPANVTTSTSTSDGPQAVVEPKSGPPGTQVTVRGSGWEPGVLIDLTGDLAPGATADPYDTVLTSQDGSFSISFRLEETPDGAALTTGRYNLIARTTGSQVTIPFLVETRRPVGASGPNG
jgi:hypothetical protein